MKHADYTCPECGKLNVKSLKSHYRVSHPDLEVPDLRNLPSPGSAPPEEVAPQVLVDESQEQPQKPNLIEKLKVFGIDPNEIMAVLSPLVEASVVKTLEKMQLGEVINKRMADIEAKLSGEVASLTEVIKQVPAQGNGQPQNGRPQNTQLRDTILASIAQKIIGGNSGDNSLDQLTKMLDLAAKVSEAVNKPRMEERLATRREISDTLKMLRDAGASPENARDTAIKSLDDHA